MIILESSWATKCKNDCGIQNDKIKIIKVMTIWESVEKLMGVGMKTEYEIKKNIKIVKRKIVIILESVAKLMGGGRKIRYEVKNITNMIIEIMIILESDVKLIKLVGIYVL